MGHAGGDRDAPAADAEAATSLSRLNGDDGLIVPAFSPTLKGG
jgi:hypothetical protein